MEERTEVEQSRIRGIPEPLPAGERLLWEGGPEFGPLLREAFHVRALLAYFAVLALFPFLGSGDGGIPPLAQATWILLLGGVMVGLAALMARLTVRTTTYAITDRRVVLRIGIALSAVVNVPLDKIGEVGLRQGKGGVGDIALSLRNTRSIGYLFLWPHARPWRVGAPEPMMRGVADAASVGALLRDAVLARVAEVGEDSALSPVAWDLTGEVDDPTGGHSPPPQRSPIPHLAGGELRSVS